MAAYEAKQRVVSLGLSLCTCAAFGVVWKVCPILSIYLAGTVADIRLKHFELKAYQEQRKQRVRREKENAKEGALAHMQPRNMLTGPHRHKPWCSHGIGCGR